MNLVVSDLKVFVYSIHVVEENIPQTQLILSNTKRVPTKDLYFNLWRFTDLELSISSELTSPSPKKHGNSLNNEHVYYLLKYADEFQAEGKRLESFIIKQILPLLSEYKPIGLKVELSQIDGWDMDGHFIAFEKGNHREYFSFYQIINLEEDIFDLVKRDGFHSHRKTELYFALKYMDELKTEAQSLQRFFIDRLNPLLDTFKDYAV